ncbi:MAG: S8 family serine peptidase [Actinobacteria bacterium]|nr:S8 family serine peptidase [Actinomycetota bacterium]
MRRPLLAALLVVLVVAAGGRPSMAAPPELPDVARSRPDKARVPEFASDRVLVRFAGAPAATVARDHGLVLGNPVGRTGFVVVETRGRGAEAVRDALARDRRVAAVTLDYRRRAAAAPNDTHYAQHQAEYLTGAGFERAWDSGAKAAATQKIAIVDTGVDLDHPDLVDSLLPGIDVVGAGDSNPQDEEGHGTMVAGMAAATTNNGRGIAGASWGAKIIPVRALDATGNGSDSDIAEGITWAVDNGATVVNLSLGGPDTSPALDAAVDYAADRNVVVVAASGNEGTNRPFFPAAHPRAFAVGASDAEGGVVSFSNYGPWVDLVAPGRAIAGTGNDVTEMYYKGAGTSFASPLVAAAATIVRTQNPSWTATQVVERLRATAADRGPAGIDDYYGWGFLDIGAAVGATASPAIGPRGADDDEPNDVPARVTAIGDSHTARIGPEGDEDWYRIDVATPTSLTLTVTPESDTVADRYAMDPVIEVFEPDGRDAGRIDITGADQPETLTVNASTAGAYLVRVWNFHPSISPSTYSVTVTRGLNTVDVTASAEHVWVEDTNLANGAVEVPVSQTLSVTFADDMDAATVTDPDNVQLVDGRTNARVAATRTYDATTRVLTVTPSAALTELRPHHLRVTGVKDSGGLTMSFDELVYFTTAAAPSPPPTTTSTTTAPPPPAPRSGYWMVDQAGHVYAFGDAQHLGALNGARTDVVDIEPTPDGNGYWLLTARGEIFSYGTARHVGQPGGLPAGETVTSMSAHPGGSGYWVFTTKGRAMPFGGAPFHGHMLGVPLNGPVLDSVATPDGGGYYMVASDGGIFAFGNAAFRGSMGGHRLNAPVQSLVPDGDNDGYWLVASDGGVFAFSAAFRGSMGSTPLNRPVTGMVRFGDGYLMVAEDGGIFNFSSKPFHGSLGSNPPPTPVVAVAALD